MSRYRLSMDIGGTFTDVVAYDEETGTYATGKTSTTPDDLTVGVLAGVGSVIESPREIAFTVHGTTVGLNAFLQRRGERVLLLATAGAADVYHIARGNRTRMYDIHYRKPRPLVPREDIVEVRGRLDYRGEEVEPLNEEDVARAIERARGEGFGAIAIAFLFSYVNPAHELRVADLVHEALPEVSISLSHQVAREWREYERTSSAVVDAYTAPVVRRYLERLEGEMRSRGLSVPLHVMQSSGGILTAKTARERPLQTLLSGPVGGTMGGAALAHTERRPNLICVDMGGTSFDVSLVVDGRPDVSTETSFEGFPLLMPIVNIHTIGAGGGSIAYAEAGGLRVGPESAGADPGPACYGRGGTQPTVTDANLVLGRIDPGYFLGGRMTLDVDGAERAVDALADEVGLSRLDMAEGIVDVINAKMAQAIRTLTVEKGIEPRDFGLVAFGGAGAMHAVFLAEELDIGEVIVPRYPGAFSAWGMLQTMLRHDTSRSFYRRAEEASLEEIERTFAELEEEGRATLEQEGIESERVELRRFADMRYEGQEYTLTVPVAGDEVTAEGIRERLGDRFHRRHDQRYGHANPGAPVEFVALRVAALGDLGRAAPERISGEDGRGTPETREVVFGRERRETMITIRSALPAGRTLDGPVIVEEETATTVVPPGWSVDVDEFGSLVVAREED